jgi:hypothetical protein
MPRLSLAAHRLAIAGGAAASFVLASCSESPNSPTREIAPEAASLSQSQELADANGRHVFHTKQWHENDNAQNDAGNAHGKPGGGTSTGIFYHGGPVLQGGTNVVAIYWGGSTIYSGGPTPGTTGSAGQDGSLVGTFLSTLGGSDYFKINSTYWDASGTHILNSVTYDGFWANPDLPTTSSISDAQMVAMLQNAFDTKKLTYTASTVYAIFTGPGVNLGGGGVVAGFSDQRQLELLVESGLTPLEAIKVCTMNGATFLGRADKVGSIAAGKQADLVVIDGDPSARIEDVRKVSLVFKQGVAYDPAKLIASVKGKVGLF